MAGPKALIALTLLLQAFSILAIDLEAPVVGCNEVGCPNSSNSTSADCQVADHNLSVIGLANLDLPLGNQSLTWTQGIEIHDNVDSLHNTTYRAYEKSFYLGLPQGFVLTANASGSGYGACALFFSEISDQVKFNGSDLATSTGTCNDALSADCTNALLKQAKDAAVSFDNSSSTADQCASIQSTLNATLPPQCHQFSTANNWQGLEVQALTGPNAPEILTAAQNSTSTCIPTLPKSNSLTRVTGIDFFSTNTDLFYAPATRYYAITPILTVFFEKSGKGPGAMFPEPLPLLTCVKAVGGSLFVGGNGTAAAKNRTDGGKVSQGVGLKGWGRSGALLGGLMMGAISVFA